MMLPDVMVCCSKKQGLTKEVHLHFLRSELQYDIENYCYIEGDLMVRDDEHAKHQTYDVGQAGNNDRVTRVLDVAFAQVVELCYPYTKRPLRRERTGREDELEETDEYVMHLSVPATFSATTVELLEKLIHELLVYKVMADWMSLTKPESKAAWEERIASAEEEVRSTLNARMGRVRRTLTPF